MAGPRVKYSKTVDMYAFGVMCSELLTWTRAYHDVQVASVFSLRDKVVNQGLRPTIPPHIRNASPTTRIVGTCSALHGVLCLLRPAHPLPASRPLLRLPLCVEQPSSVSGAGVPVSTSGRRLPT